MTKINNDNKNIILYNIYIYNNNFSYTGSFCNIEYTVSAAGSVDVISSVIILRGSESKKKTNKKISKKKNQKSKIKK